MNGELIQGAGGRMEVALGKMQIDRGVFQARMSHQKLNGPQIRPCLQVMRCKTVSPMSPET